MVVNTKYVKKNRNKSYLCNLKNNFKLLKNKLLCLEKRIKIVQLSYGKIPNFKELTI